MSERIKVGIVGLGLMGGSIALALRKTGKSYYFVGLDHNPKHCEEALKLGIVDEIAEDLDALETCDIVFLSVPVDAIIAIAERFEPKNEACTVIDLGSTKARISQSIPAHKRHFFVTAHPMTGTEKFGPQAAFDELYEGKVVVLCDPEKSGALQRERAVELFTSLHMKIVYMDAEEHDRHAAFISHMPHAVSYALANAVMRQEDPESIVALAGGGFRDMSRIAKSSPQMWSDIFIQNADHVLEAIESFQTELQKAKEMVERRDEAALQKWMQSANELHKIL
jgi:prephenate dehydrogenase